MEEYIQFIEANPDKISWNMVGYQSNYHTHYKYYLEHIANNSDYILK